MSDQEHDAGSACPETGGGSCSESCSGPCAEVCAGGGTEEKAAPSARGRLSRLFGRCAGCAGPAAGGALLSHAACFLVPVIAGVSGAATGAMLHAAMFVASPAIAAGAVLGIARWRGESVAARPVLVHAGISATIALAVTFGLSALGGGHDGHHGHDHGHHAHDPAAAAAWFDTLPADDREKIEDIAGRAGIGVRDYVLELRGIPALSAEEKETLRDTVGKTCPCQVPGACKIQGLTP